MKETEMIGTKADRYPPTIWSRIREEVLPALILVGLMAVVLGMIFDAKPVVAWGLVWAGVSVVMFVPVLFLEYRADMAYDRRQDAAESEARP